MAGLSPTNVNTAFDMLVQEIQASAESLGSNVSSLIAEGDFEGARGLIDKVEKLADLKSRVAALRKEWTDLGITNGKAASRAVRRRRKLGAAKRGIQVGTDAYRIPLLKALCELGGAAHKGKVLARVEELMRGTLGPVAYTAVASSARRPRWLVRAEWVRFRLVREGLMKSDSPRGIWEITDAGRDCLAKNQSAVINPQ